MHSKVMYVRRHDSNAASSPTGCYAYVGSANLSESAWYVSNASPTVTYFTGATPLSSRPCPMLTFASGSAGAGLFEIGHPVNQS